MNHHHPPASQCSVCHKATSRGFLLPPELIRPQVVELIKKNQAEWKPAPVCLSCLTALRTKWVEGLLQEEKGNLDQLEKEVLKSFEDEASISENVNQEYEEQISFGERVSDQIASFGGSWVFIFSFLGILLIWIVFNIRVQGRERFDPYPFILLNLVLSCIAALQAPVIMMSQNRQEQKDRLRNEHDYQVNLKAELEIRALHLKIDQLMTQQWQHLLEIQQAQIEILNEQTQLMKTPSKN